jgi:hypothetical protein
MRRSWVLATLIAVLTPSAALHAQDHDPSSLAGLAGVFVSAHASGRDLPDGLTDEMLVSDIERDLRRAGVPVLSEDDLQKAAGAPVLQVSVVTVLASSASGMPLGFGYAIQVEVVQNVVLERDGRARHVAATTWRRPVTVAVASVDGAALAVDRDVREEVQQFAAAYREANSQVRPAGRF